MSARITAFLNSALGGGATFYKSHIFWGNVIVLVAGLVGHLPTAISVGILAAVNAVAGALEA
jgi:hypothetical protein